VSQTIEIKDAGPIESLTIPVPEGGGVVVLRGPNGGGKSTALNAVTALVSGAGTVPTRDGALGAIVEGLGARLTVGRRTGRSGELELHHLEGPDPSLLVDPGIKDRGAAHAERIRALARLANATLDRERIVSLVGGPDAFAALVRAESLEKGDVPSICAAVKRDLETAARAAETEADNLQTEARGISASVDAVPEAEMLDEAALQQELELASGQLGELRGRQSQADKLRAAAEAARQTLAGMGERGTVDAGRAAEAQLAQAEAATKAMRGALEAKSEAVQAAKVALAKAIAEADLANAAVQTALAQEDMARATLLQAEKDYKARNQLGAAMKAADAAAFVDPSEVTAWEERQTAARLALQRAEVVRFAMDQRERAKVKSDESGAARSRALGLRRAASGCEAIISEALAKVCPAGMLVHEGMLVVKTDRGLEPFDELSHGERWRWAIEIAARTVKAPGLLVCRQEGWESLQPSVQRDVDAMAREHGLVILAAKADDGELRAEVFGGA
jgi:energy-coupling factor transporter ATP-binding protein EcfA2